MNCGNLEGVQIEEEIFTLIWSNINQISGIKH